MLATLWLNIVLMAVFFGLCVGIPVWLVLKRPDRKPEIAAAPAVRRVPEPRGEVPGYQRVA
jgi:hypothetical protein